MTTSTTSRLKDQRARDYARVINYLNRTKDRKSIPASARINIAFILILTAVAIAIVAISNL